MANCDGQVFVFFVIVVAAAEAAVGLAIVITDHAKPSIAQRGTRGFAETLMPILDSSLDYSRAAARGRRDQRAFREVAGRKPVDQLPSRIGSISLAFLAALEAGARILPASGRPDSLDRRTISPGSPPGPSRPDFALQVDQLTVVMLLVVTCVGWLIHIYSTGYMARRSRLLPLLLLT